MLYKKSWVFLYYNFDVKTDNGIVSFYNMTKRRPVSTPGRFSVWLKMDDSNKLYFNTKQWWNENHPESNKWIQSFKLSNVPHGFQTNNAPGTKTHLFVPPFFIVYRTVGAINNFLSFKGFNRPNIEESILAMLTFDEDRNTIEPLFTPDLVLPYSNVLSLNNFLEFYMIDSRGEQIIVSDMSQLFILLSLL
jgi:hypothetical protein